MNSIPIKFYYMNMYAYQHYFVWPYRYGDPDYYGMNWTYLNYHYRPHGILVSA